jgi:hypothetical protein
MDNKKAIIAGGVFLTVLAGASALYIYLASKDHKKPRRPKRQRKPSTDSSEEEPKSMQLQEDLEVIGSIDLDSYGNLNFTDFCRLYTLIKKHI